MRRLLFSTAPLILVLALAGCGGQHGGGFTMPPRPVTTAAVAQQDVPVYLDEIGNCVSPETVAIIPQVTGKITEVHFTEGADVKKGDPLFTIDPRPYQAALDQAAAALAEDEAKVRLSQDQLDRSQKLVSGNYISAQDIQTLQTTVATDKAQLQADQAAVDNAKLNVEYCSITAPIDGRLGKRLVDVGNVVTANIGSVSSASTSGGTSSTTSGNPLVVIQRTDRLYVDFTVAETDLDSVRNYLAKGPLQIVASLPDHPEVNRTGALHFLDNTVQVSAGTVQLRGEIANEDRAFWPGQFVNVRLVLQTIQGAFLVPSQALQISQQGPFVFVVKDDQTVELRPVQPGQRQGDNTVVTSGLQSGETVVVTGQLALAPGAKVAPTPADAPAAPEKAPGT